MIENQVNLRRFVISATLAGMLPVNMLNCAQKWALEGKTEKTWDLQYNRIFTNVSLKYDTLKLVISTILLGILPVNEQFPKDSWAKIIEMWESRGSRSGRETNDHLPRVFDFVSSLGMLPFSWLLPKNKCSLVQENNVWGYNHPGYCCTETQALH